MSWLSLFGRVRTPRPRKAPLRRDRLRLACEALEDRCVPATFNVNTLLDVAFTAANVNAQGVIANSNGQVTLRSAIQAANATTGANTINLTLPGVYQIALPNAAGTFAENNNLTGDFDILPPPNSAGGSSLTIANTSGGFAAVDAAGLDRAFDINPANVNVPLTATNTPGFTVTMSGFTIENGRAVTDTTLPVAQQGASGSGGGIRDTGNVSLTLTSMVVTNNSTQNDGGGVAMENLASTKWTLTVTNSTISNNHAGDAGGGLETDGAGKTIVSGSTLSGNTSTNQGAGIWLDAIQNGAVFESSSLTVTNSTVSGNLAYSPGNVGGGIGQAGNGNVGGGGAVVGVIITNSTISGNFSGGVGGGYGDEQGGSNLVVVNSTFANNVSIDNGGGIEATGGLTSISDSTIVGNTVQGTTGSGIGGGVNVASGTFNLNNTIVAGNFSNGPGAGNANFGGTAPDIKGAVTAGSGNFIGIGDGNVTGISNNTNSNQIGTTAAPLFARLGPLQNNGGPTLTMAPLLGSPVIDKGVNNAVPNVDPITNNPLTDQRGFLRIVGNTVDIGAVEFQSPAVTIALTVTPNPATFGKPATLTATLTPTGGAPNNPVTGTVTFFTGATILGTAPVTNGVATLQTSALPQGNNVQVTAKYSGDTNFSGATSPPVPLKVIAPRTIGAFDPTTATFYLRDSNTPGAPNAGQFQFGGPGWQGVVGDFAGTGQTTVAVVDPTGKWYIRFSNSAGTPDVAPFAFGGPGWIPLTGFWTQADRQSGKVGIGVYDPNTGTFYLKNTQGPGAPDFTIPFGRSGLMPVVGDWNGDGVDTIGVVDPTSETWYLRNENSAGGPDAATPFQYGAPGWKAVVGDFGGTGKTGIGVVDPQGNWYLKTTIGAGTPDIPKFAFGIGTWTPLAGQWDAVPVSNASADLG